MAGGIDRLHVFKKLDDYPLVVSAGKSLQTVYAAWQREAAMASPIVTAHSASMRLPMTMR